ncbi:PQQ-dependent sugar dehydrogenase, partial [Akkermansiaceae bacterium]|nr:PQQ-dependent sugar dehydrogenase [Akkermansiaceae bacterium]MDA7888683.1 PQQ-dependent sugar dehydrogenase [Akkermansiaceae bacterium]
MLRIDVDKLPGNVEPNPHPSVPTDGGIAHYSVPADNPFVTANPTVTFNGQNLPAASVRTEFYAVGLRNPFRFSVDPDTG